MFQWETRTTISSVQSLQPNFFLQFGLATSVVAKTRNGLIPSWPYLQKAYKLSISPCKWNCLLLIPCVLFPFLLSLPHCFYFPYRFPTSTENAFSSRIIHQPKLFPSFLESSSNNPSQIIQASWKVKSRNTTAKEKKLGAEKTEIH